MAEIINCPNCQRQLQLPQELSGQKVRCPSCNEMFVAAFGAPASPPSQPQPASYTTAPPLPPNREAGAHQRHDYPDRFHRDDDDYEDEEEYESYRRRRRRRDLVPHRGGLILTLGIISLVANFMCYGVGLFFAIPAWIMGSHDLKEMREGRMDSDGEGITQGGRICGIISTVLSIVCVAGVGLYILLMIVVAAAGNRNF